MRRPAKIASSILVLLVAVLVAGAMLLAHNSPAPPQHALPPNAVPMKAVVFHQYGPADVLRFEQVAKPVPTPDELLIKVQDAALNPLDWHDMLGSPYVLRLQRGIGAPTRDSIGVDFSGTVEAVGARVRKFKVGDAIFGTADGAVAEYVTSTEVGLALKPGNVSFEQAAAAPVAGITALQALDAAHIRPGQKVLINGASGGVGTFAVQIARALGAEVTGVCSTRHLALVRSIGASQVIDYTREDFTRGTQHYDVIFDAVPNHRLRDYERILNPNGVVLLVGAEPSFEPWFGPLAGIAKVWLVAPFLHARYVQIFADANRTDDLERLADLMRAGKVVPVIDRRYPLRDTAAAMRYLERGHAGGKVIITVQ